MSVVLGSMLRVEGRSVPVDRNHTSPARESISPREVWARTFMCAQVKGEPMLLKAALGSEFDNITKNRFNKDGVDYYRHWDLPSGIQMMIPIEYGRHRQAYVSSIYADYLAGQQELMKSDYISLADSLSRLGDSAKGISRVYVSRHRFVNFDQHTGMDQLFFPYHFIADGEAVRAIHLVPAGGDFVILRSDADFMAAMEMEKATRFISVGDFSRDAGTTIRSVHNWIQDGKLEGFRCGKEVYVLRGQSSELSTKRLEPFQALPTDAVPIDDLFRALGYTRAKYDHVTPSADGRRMFETVCHDADGKQVKLKIPVFETANQGQNSILYVSQEDLKKACGYRSSISNWVSQRSFKEQSGIDLSNAPIVSGTGSYHRSKLMRLQLTPFCCMGIRYIVERKERLFHPEDAKRVLEIISSFGRYPSTLRSIKYADELLMPHFDRECGLLRLTCGNHDYGGLAIPAYSYRRSNLDSDYSEDSVIIRSCDQPLVDMYVGLMKRYPTMNAKAVEVLEKLAKGRISDEDTRMILVMRGLAMVLDSGYERPGMTWFKMIFRDSLFGKKWNDALAAYFSSDYYRPRPVPSGLRSNFIEKE